MRPEVAPSANGSQMPQRRTNRDTREETDMTTNMTPAECWDGWVGEQSPQEFLASSCAVGRDHQPAMR